MFLKRVQPIFNGVKTKISCQRVKTKLAYVFKTSAADIQRS